MEDYVIKQIHKRYKIRDNHYFIKDMFPGTYISSMYGISEDLTHKLFWLWRDYIDGYHTNSTSPVYYLGYRTYDGLNVYSIQNNEVLFNQIMSMEEFLNKN